VGAAVVRAEHLETLRIGGRADERVAGGRSRDPTRRARRDPAGLARGSDDAPGAALERHLHDGHAHRVLGLEDFLGAPAPEPVGKEEALVEVLVVYREEAVGGAVRAVGQREEMHAVVMHAGLQGLLGGTVRGVETKLRTTLGNADRVAPAIEHGGLVLRGYTQGVLAGRSDGREREGGSRASGPGGGAAGQRGQDCERGACAEKLPPREPRGQHVGEGGRGRRP